MNKDVLYGKLETITMMELRLRMGEVVQQVKMGKQFILSHGGKPFGVLQKLPADLTTVVESDGSLNYQISK